MEDKNPLQDLLEFFTKKLKSARNVFDFRDGYVIESSGMVCPKGFDHMHLNVALKRDSIPPIDFFAQDHDGIKTFRNEDELYQYIMTEIMNDVLSGEHDMPFTPTPMGMMGTPSMAIPVQEMDDGRIKVIVDKKLLADFQKEQDSAIVSVVLPLTMDATEAMRWIDTMAIAMISKEGGIHGLAHKIERSGDRQSLKFSPVAAQSCNLKRGYLISSATNRFFLARHMINPDNPEKISFVTASKNLIPAMTDLLGVGHPQMSDIEEVGNNFTLKVYSPVLDYEIALKAEDLKMDDTEFEFIHRPSGKIVATGVLNAKTFMEDIFNPMAENSISQGFVCETAIDEFADMCRMVEARKDAPLQILENNKDAYKPANRF